MSKNAQRTITITNIYIYILCWFLELLNEYSIFFQERSRINPEFIINPIFSSFPFFFSFFFSYFLSLSLFSFFFFSFFSFFFSSSLLFLFFFLSSFSLSIFSLFVSLFSLLFSPPFLSLYFCFSSSFLLFLLVLVIAKPFRIASSKAEQMRFDQRCFINLNSMANINLVGETQTGSESIWEQWQ